MNEKTPVSRSRAIRLSRVTTVAAVAGSLGGYFVFPVGPATYAVDILVRAYLGFVAGAMAHEASHGHMGHSRRANLWWGRLAMIPTTVPFVTFRKTHLRHHAATNVRGDDPDEFLNTPRAWEIPLRALALPHHWVAWLVRHRRWTRADAVEYLLTYAGYAAIYGTLASVIGAGRVATGLFPALALHAFLLWYGFAIKTHEGYSTGALETRSHNYHGRPLYWLSFGLSMHRLHHLKPGLAWLEMSDRVPRGTWRQRMRLERDIQTEPVR